MDEYTLIKKIKDTDDETSLKLLIKKYEPAIRKMACQISFKDYEDLVQMGNIAVWIAAQKYDKDKNVTFTTYVFNMIRGHMLTYQRDTMMMKITRHQAKNEDPNNRNTYIKADICSFDDIDFKDYPKYLTSISDTDICYFISQSCDIEALKEELQKKLTEKQYMVFCSFYGIMGYNKLSIEEIEEKYNFPQKSIYSLTCNTRRDLRKNKKLQKAINEV